MLYQCTSLTTVFIPESVTSIGQYFLASCSSIADVYCYAESLPETSSYAFSYYGEKYISAATLHVPEVSIDLYKATKPWSDFGTIVPLKDEDAIEDVKANENALEADYYDIHGIKMAKPQKDIYIIRHSDGTTRKVLIK